MTVRSSPAVATMPAENPAQGDPLETTPTWPCEEWRDMQPRFTRESQRLNLFPSAAARSAGELPSSPGGRNAMARGRSAAWGAGVKIETQPALGLTRCEEPEGRQE